jgi:hypothetical protein
MKLGIIIPSRLALRPGGRFLEEFGPELWLDGALASAKRQLGCTCCSKIFVGVDPEAFVPLHIFTNAAVVRATSPGQSAAVNVAAAAALGWGATHLLFLEDDDRWLGSKAQVQLPYLRSYDFVSCSQLLVDEGGLKIGTNDYPTPSGWCMTSAIWEKVGPFNENMKWRVDTEWLGRLSQAKFRRAHLVPKGMVHAPNKLPLVAQFSEVIPCYESVFLVDRTVNPKGGMATIFEKQEATLEAEAEARDIRKRFGFDPW